ncbi:hypothetical protein FRB90_005506 [Tulasnella sp. 427]|nr:hypothetical protein FRB90_005506 [Tulasnella sp. 427]
MLRKTSSSRSAGDSASTSGATSQTRPSSPRPGLLRQPSAFRGKLQKLKHVLQRSRSDDKDFQLSEEANAQLELQYHRRAHSSQVVHTMTQDDSALFTRPRRPDGLGHSYHGRIATPKSTPNSPSQSPIIFRQGGTPSTSSTPSTAARQTFPPNTSALLTPPNSLGTAPTAFSPLSSAFTSPLSTTDLITANKRIAELESQVAQLQKVHAYQVQGMQDLFTDIIVPRVTTFVKQLDSEVSARKVAEERFALEYDAHSRTDEMRLDERERRWDMEELMLEAQRELKEERKKYAELQAKFRDLQIQTDFLHAEALQAAMRRLGIFDIPNAELCCAMFEDCVELFLRHVASHAERDRDRRREAEERVLEREWREQREREYEAYLALREQSEDEESYSGDDEREGPPSDEASDSPKWFKKRSLSDEDVSPGHAKLQFDMIQETVADSGTVDILGSVDSQRAAFDRFGRQTKDLHDQSASVRDGTSDNEKPSHSVDQDDDDDLYEDAQDQSSNIPVASSSTPALDESKTMSTLGHDADSLETEKEEAAAPQTN